MATTGRHRASSSVVWIPILISALLGVTLGSCFMALADGSGTASTTHQTAELSPGAAPPSMIANPLSSIGFGEPTTGPADLSLTVLPPEKIKGGVRLTIALVNNTEVPVTMNTGDLGPHEPRFDGATVPMTMTPATKKLVPGEGYTYQCVLNLPTMDVGELAFTLGAVTITDRAAGD
ncbi:MAG: hypothetical protein ACRDTG_07310 [Pseudonocardiaceae bacterium]